MKVKAVIWYEGLKLKVKEKNHAISSKHKSCHRLPLIKRNISVRIMLAMKTFIEINC